MVPVKKKSKCAKRKRRSHHAISATHIVSCPKCSNPKLPHAACGSCGYVSGKQMLVMSSGAA